MDEYEGMTEAEITALQKAKEAKAQATILEMVRACAYTCIHAYTYPRMCVVAGRWGTSLTLTSSLLTMCCLCASSILSLQARTSD